MLGTEKCACQDNMLTSPTALSFVSLNINGTKDKDLQIDELLNFDVVFLQEHLLSKVNTNSLRRSATHDIFIREAKKTRGRPSGGTAIFIRSGYQPMQIYSDANILAIQCNNMAFVNVYLPCNHRNTQSFTAFAKACHKLKSLFIKFADKNVDWILAGDMNTDILTSSDRSELLLDSLPSVYHVAAKNLAYTYIHNRGSVKSNLDHIIVSKSGLIKSEVFVDEDKINDDHLPISCLIEPPDVQAHFKGPHSKWYQKPNWNRINVEMYITTLCTLLSTIKVPFHLLQTSIKCPDSKEDLNSYYYQIVACLKSATKVAVPIEHVRSGSRKPLWNIHPEVKKVKNRAKFWLRLWNACDRPSSGAVFTVKQKTKKEYKSCLRNARLNAWDAPNSKMTWNRVINSSKCSPPPQSELNLMNFVRHYIDIFSVFNQCVQKHFSNLLSSVLPVSVCQYRVPAISMSDLHWALKKVKRSDSPDCDGLCFRNFAYDCPLLLNHLQLLFQICIAQSLVPDSFLSGSVTPILKRGKDPDSCSNYRPITVSCFMSKIFEYVLLPEITSKCDFSSFQLGFRRGVGCPQAHHVLSRLLKEAFAQKRSLYCCTVDISGAFDNVVHAQALHSLACSGVNYSVISTLRYWYDNSYVRIKWLSNTSDSVAVRKGVRQGGVLSPYIFKCVLATCLKHLSPTVFFRDIGVSYIAYADDVLLVSFSRRGLAQNFRKLSSLLSDIGLSVNMGKCEFMCFNSSISVSPLNLGSISLPCLDKVKWLGISFCPSIYETCSELVTNALKNIRVSYGKISPNRGRYNRKGLARLYNSFCSPGVNFLSGFHHLLRKKDLRRLRSGYFRYCKYLMYLPGRFKNRNIVSRYGVIDACARLASVSSNMIMNTSNVVSVTDPLVCFFHRDIG